MISSIFEKPLSVRTIGNYLGFWSNRYFPSLDDLTNVVREQFERWILPNTILQKLCVVN
jgi:hypothetical protein